VNASAEEFLGERGAIAAVVSRATEYLCFLAGEFA
jgi:hypothetical protein